MNVYKSYELKHNKQVWVTETPVTDAEFYNSKWMHTALQRAQGVVGRIALERRPHTFSMFCIKMSLKLFQND